RRHHAVPRAGRRPVGLRTARPELQRRSRGPRRLLPRHVRRPHPRRRRPRAGAGRRQRGHRRVARPAPGPAQPGRGLASIRPRPAWIRRGSAVDPTRPRARSAVPSSYGAPYELGAVVRVRQTRLRRRGLTGSRSPGAPSRAGAPGRRIPGPAPPRPHALATTHADELVAPYRARTVHRTRWAPLYEFAGRGLRKRPPTGAPRERPARTVALAATHGDQLVASYRPRTVHRTSWARSYEFAGRRTLRAQAALAYLVDLADRGPGAGADRGGRRGEAGGRRAARRVLSQPSRSRSHAMSAP